jgi:hypothetical protein
MERIKCIITDNGDPSVGIFPQTWYLWCPFTMEDVDEDDLTFFKKDVHMLYSPFAEGRLDVYYDFETEGDCCD